MRNDINAKTKSAPLNAITGKVIAYSAAVNAGAIKTINGQRYTFFKKEWLGEKPPAHNMTVTFQPSSSAALKVCAA